MTVRSAAEAVARLRKLLDLPASPEGSAWHVRRLDGQGAYFLVQAADRVACIDAISGELLTSATSPRAPVAVAREHALALAALGTSQSAELVWKPCAATMSMFDPLWSVSNAGQRVFIDQRGQVWTTLPPKRAGG